MSASLSPPACGFANNLRAHTRFSHATSAEVCARNTFAPLGSVLSCITKTLCEALQLYWPVARRATTVAMFFPVLRRDPSDVIFKRRSVAKKTHVRQCDLSLAFGWHAWMFHFLENSQHFELRTSTMRVHAPHTTIQALYNSLLQSTCPCLRLSRFSSGLDPNFPPRPWPHWHFLQAN